MNAVELEHDALEITTFLLENFQEMETSVPG